MAEFIEYAGRKYWLQSSGRYFQSGIKTDNERLLHRRIWSDANGQIPPKHHIHHINGDWRDNDIQNLECVLGIEHSRDHMLERNATPEGRKATLGALAKAAPMAKEWHASEEGRQWHRKHATTTLVDRPLVNKVCERCKASFQTKNPHIAIYCSSACMQAIAFRRYFDDPRECAHCGNGFLANCHRATAFCSRACSNQRRVAA